MRIFVNLFVSMLMATTVIGQGEAEVAVIQISPESEIYIEGSTNVNTFTCQFNTRLITRPQQIQYNRDDTHLYFSNTELKLAISGFDCGNKKMNSDFQDLLSNGENENINIILHKIEFFTEGYAKAYVSINISDKKRKYEFPVSLNEERNSGKLKLDIRDFGLEPPTKAFGLIQVDEDIIIHFRLKIDD